MNYFKKILVLCILILLAANAIYSQQITVSVSDFSVESGNENYAYIGKGISSLVAGELRSTSGIRILERDKLNEIIEEQKLSLSGLVDDSRQVEIGKLMAADYIIYGKIIDMVTNLLFTVRMADVSTGEIVWEDSLSKKLENYDYIGAYFAKSIIDEFALSAKSETLAKVEGKSTKDEKAIVTLSEGIDAYDNGDTKQAIKALEKVRILDPDNEAATYFLSKLISNSARFKIVSEPYNFYNNPAFLGIQKKDKFYFAPTGNLDYFFRDFGSFEYPIIDVSGEKYELYEERNLANIGYSTPVGDNLGIDLEFMFSVNQGGIEGVEMGRIATGGGISIGYHLLNNFSIGLGAAGFRVFGGQWKERDDINLFGWSADYGMLYQNNAKDFLFDMNIQYSNITKNLFDESAVAIGQQVMWPLFIENTATFILNENRTFLILKQINEISFDTIYYLGRLIPGIEHSVTDWFSIRAGIDGSIVKVNETLTPGLGLQGGCSFHIGEKWDIDLNLTYRERPSIYLPEEPFDELMFLLTVSGNGLFMER